MTAVPAPEDIVVPPSRPLPRGGHRLDERRPAGELGAMLARPVPAREVRGGDWLVGLAARPLPHGSDRWRLGRVLMRSNTQRLTRIEARFPRGWVVWEGDAGTPIPVYRR
ncbi:hypothetical protein [Streptomyces buecherae]|uniref:Uncharacterized protein n=1 Tax=Streptomyces buecherae TaxID=2763006 RepID=A0A7H8N3J3_9ACTN|nr:hypothetical protein [Streptomyces buecherae]QKW48883.1 hypothetical protein HUT08_04245 [Streptomyces buecherae]